MEAKAGTPAYIFHQWHEPQVVPGPCAFNPAATSWIFGNLRRKNPIQKPSAAADISQNEMKIKNMQELAYENRGTIKKYKLLTAHAIDTANHEGSGIRSLDVQAKENGVTKKFSCCEMGIDFRLSECNALGMEKQFRFLSSRCHYFRCRSSK